MSGLVGAIKSHQLRKFLTSHSEREFWDTLIPLSEEEDRLFGKAANFQGPGLFKAIRRHQIKNTCLACGKFKDGFQHERYCVCKRCASRHVCFCNVE